MIVKESFDTYCQKKEWINPSSFKGEKIRTPLHFWYWFNNQQTDTLSMKTGRALHTIILEPEKFEKEFAYLTLDLFSPNCKKSVTTGFPLLTDKYNKIIYEDFTNRNAGKTILTFNEYESVRGMALGLTRDIKDLRYLINLKNGFVEYSIYIFAEFDEYGQFIQLVNMSIEEYEAMTPKQKSKFLKVKTRPDYWSKQKEYSLDLKSTKSADRDNFVKDCSIYGYYQQASFILDCLNCSYPQKHYETFFFIVVENSSPFASITMQCSDRMLSAGRSDYIYKLQGIHKCMQSKKYRGFDIFSDYVTLNDDGVEIQNRQILVIDFPQYWYNKREQKIANNQTGFIF